MYVEKINGNTILNLQDCDLNENGKVAVANGDAPNPFFHFNDARKGVQLAHIVTHIHNGIGTVLKSRYDDQETELVLGYKE